MLTIYSAQEFRDDCLIEVKDYFDLERRHWNEWLNQEKVKEIIKDIDNTIAVKDSYLESPVFGAMSPDRLSTGCKGVILLQVLDDINLYATRCGDNCVPQILRIAQEKDIRITLHHYMKFPEEFPCKVVMAESGKVIKGMEEFEREFYRIRCGIR